MDDDEDFEGLFFEECQELLSTLQEHLDDLAEGNGDDETVNAAFRAVHSVKGGAAAFGFNDLINFAHVFETVMDRVRSHELDLTEEIGLTLLRAGDIMVMLVEKARERAEPPRENLDKVRHELEVLANLATGAEEVPEESLAQEDEASGGLEPSASGETTADSLDDGETAGGGDGPALQEYVFRYRPGPDHLRSGHDPLKLMRAARALGLTSSKVSGEVPGIADFDPMECPLEWELTFQTDKSKSELDAFFEMYRLTADIEPVGAENPAEPASIEPAPEPAAEASDKMSDEDQTADASLAQDPVPSEATQAQPPARQDAANGGNGGGASAGAAPPGGGRGGPQKSLRVELTRIDRLVNLVGEMLITQAGLAQRIAERDSNDELELSHAVDAMSRQLRELQESVMAIRAQPVKAVFSRMPRIVRDLAEKLGKDVRLELSGEQTEVDTTVIEELSEPLTHMLRNSMDHGIEDSQGRAAASKPRTGHIRLSAEHRGERVIITVADDGRGVNRDRVLKKAVERGLVGADDVLSPEEIDQLIFHPGFSTAETISSVSGRGVGMDVVKKKIQSLGGRCSLKNTPGKGTEFNITLPLTLAVMDGMTIRVAGQQFILPLSSVVEAVKIDTCTVRRLPDESTLLERRGEYLRLINLRSALNMPGDANQDNMAIVVDTETIGLVALRVEDLVGQRQVVLKSLEANFQRVEGIAGATILGDGHVALILDVPSLISMGGEALSQEVFL